MSSEEERNQPGNYVVGLSNLQMRALNDSMTNLTNTGFEQIHQRLDEIQGSQQTRPRTGTRRDRPRRPNRSDDEIQEEEDDDRSINRPRRGQRNRDQGDVNHFARNERAGDSLGGLKLKIPTNKETVCTRPLSSRSTPETQTFASRNQISGGLLPGDGDLDDHSGC